MAIANDEMDVAELCLQWESQILSGNLEAGVQDLHRVLQIGASYPSLAPGCNARTCYCTLNQQ
ncbi:MAG: hypothetical protein R3C68_11195 [Myxococcota bacterium]